MPCHCGRVRAEGLSQAAAVYTPMCDVYNTWVYPDPIAKQVYGPHQRHSRDTIVTAVTMVTVKLIKIVNIKT